MSDKIHPKPSDMARAAYGDRATVGTRTVYEAAIHAERRRLATDYLARAREAQDRATAASAIDDGEAWARAMGQVETLSALAAELIP